jgi:hypothetical protein
MAPGTHPTPFRSLTDHQPGTACQSYAWVTTVDTEGPAPARLLATPWPPSTASPAPTLTGPTPRASVSGNARPLNWPKNETGSAGSHARGPPHQQPAAPHNRN